MQIYPRSRSRTHIYTTALATSLTLYLTSGCGSADPDPSEPSPQSSAGTSSVAGAGQTSPGAATGSGGAASSSAASASCFGHPEAGEQVSDFGRCLYSECCGSTFSCSTDTLCNDVYGCVLAATTEAAFKACTDRLEGVANIASKLWFLNLYSCTAASCADRSRPAPADPCAAYTSCSACLNGSGISSNGWTGNCGWMSDGKCHSGSTRGPNDPAHWGADNKWTFFDDAACPGAGGSDPSGCTNDVDCGSCERCERSTGKCIQRLNCSN